VPAVFTRVPFFTMATGVEMAILATAAVGLVLLLGHAGQISLGQAAFYGIGAYTSAILTTDYGVPPLAAVVAGVAVSGGVAWLTGLAIFRVKGHYLALATLAFGLTLGFLARQLDITGGASGIVDIPRLAFGTWVFDSDLRFYYLAAGVLMLAVWGARNIIGSVFGRSLLALGDSEVAAASVGVDTARHKRVVFVVAAGFASLAGSLYAHWVTFVDFHTLDLLLSIELLIMAAVGGLRSVWGAPVGAFVVLSLSQAARELLPKVAPNVGGEFEIAVYGVALILTLSLLPAGVAGGAGQAWSALRRREEAAT
jgi:branched-chain amino acid transport system permease protein